MTFHWYDGVFPEMVPREEMPQVDERDLPALRHFAATLGLEVTEELVPPGELHIHQAVDRLRVETIARSSALLKKPCLTSREPYVLDGYHRTAAHLAVGSPVPVIKFPLPFAAAVQFLFRFPRTYTLAQVGSQVRN